MALGELNPKRANCGTAPIQFCQPRQEQKTKGLEAARARQTGASAILKEDCQPKLREAEKFWLLSRTCVAASDKRTLLCERVEPVQPGQKWLRTITLRHLWQATEASGLGVSDARCEEHKHCNPFLTGREGTVGQQGGVQANCLPNSLEPYSFVRSRKGLGFPCLGACAASIGPSWHNKEFKFGLVLDKSGSGYFQVPSRGKNWTPIPFLGNSRFFRLQKIPSTGILLRPGTQLKKPFLFPLWFGIYIPQKLTLRRTDHWLKWQSSPVWK